MNSILRYSAVSSYLPARLSTTGDFKLYQEEPSKLAYSLREASTASSLSRSTLYRLISHGTLSTVKVGGRTLIPATALQQLISEATN